MWQEFDSVDLQEGSPDKKPTAIPRLAKRTESNRWGEVMSQ